MPSEVQTPATSDVEAVVALLEEPTQLFRSALALAMEQVRGMVESCPRAQGPPGAGRDAGRDAGRSDRRQAALGAFAQEYLRTDRFVALQNDADETDQVTQRRLETVLATLLGASRDARGCTCVEVGRGQGLYAAVDGAMTKIGRAFGAARVVNLTRSSAYDESQHAALLTGFPQRAWGSVERGVAPPLIVRGDGRDLRAADLAGFLDGRQKIVLVPRGRVDSALLARLITPGTFVQQAADASELRGWAAFDGPGIAALVPEPAARFVHDPDAGTTPAQRLTIQFAPRPGDVRPPGGALGAMGVEWLRDGLRHLLSLAQSSGESAAPSGAPEDDIAPTAPVDKLAAWLVNQADLGDA